MNHPIRIFPSSIVTGLLVGALAVWILVRWNQMDPTADFTMNVPGQDNAERMRAATKEVVSIGELSERFEAVPFPDLNGTWSQFRGENQSNIKNAGVSLASDWAVDGPTLMWSRSVGEGHAAASIHKGRVFVLDYDETLGADMLRCLSLDSGEEIWRCGYQVKIKRNHGISRTVPAVTDDYVVTIGPRCHVMCVDTNTGEFLWGLDMKEVYGSEIPFWYTGQCPLIHNDQLILAPTGSSLLVGVDLATGEILWNSPNERALKMSHASVVPMTFNGIEMYVYSAVGGVVGISAESDNEGVVLWQSNAWKHSVVAPSAVQLPESRIFLTAGYGAGSMVIQLQYDDLTGRFHPEVVQEFDPDEGLASEQQTPILFDGKLFSIQPKDAGGYRNQLVCVDPLDCTQVIWSSGKQKRFGLGPYMVADGKMFILDDDGTLTMIEASTESYQELAQFSAIPNGHDAWGPLSIADGFMILRDSKTMVCLDLAENRSEKL